MSKSLKDIVEEGFDRLAILSERRKELLGRCEELSDGAASKQCAHGIEKLEANESSYTNEVKNHVERSREGLQQALLQVTQDNESFMASLKENLQLRITRVQKELGDTRDWLLTSSIEKIDSSFRPLQKGSEEGGNELEFEAAKLLAEMELCCRRTQSSLLEAQAEFATKLSSAEKHLAEDLHIELQTLLLQSANREKEVMSSLDQMYSNNSSELEKLGSEMEKRITIVVGKSLDSSKKLGRDVDKALDKTRDAVIAEAAAEIVSLSEQSLAQLRGSYESRHQDLSEKLKGLQGQTERLLNQVKEFLQDLEENIRVNGKSISERVKVQPSELPSSDAGRGEIDETIKVLSKDLDATAIELKRQLNELLRIQTDRLLSLCSASESSLAATAQALNTELKQMIRLHEQTWSEKEQELHARLKKIDKEAQETFELVGDSGDSSMGGK